MTPTIHRSVIQVHSSVTTRASCGWSTPKTNIGQVHKPHPHPLPVHLIILSLSCLLLFTPLQWRHNEHDGASNHRRLYCLLNRLFRCRSKETSKLRVIGLCVGTSPVNSPHKGPIARKMFPFDGVILLSSGSPPSSRCRSHWLPFFIY